MPHLVYYDYLWRISTDEFAIPSIFSIIARIIWTILMLICCIITVNNLSSCSLGWLFIIYLFLSILTFILCIIFDFIILYISLQGTILEINKRSSILFYISIRNIYVIISALLSIFGILILSLSSTIPCNHNFQYSNNNNNSKINVHELILVIVILQLIDFIFFFCFCYLCISNHKDQHLSYNNKDSNYMINLWENRCRKLTQCLRISTCNVFGGNNINEGRKCKIV